MRFIMVSLQYAVGRRPTAVNIRIDDDDRYFLFYRRSQRIYFLRRQSVFLVLSAAVFTIAEIIYAPVEYMLIDNITPVGMKASYFSAQSLGWLERR
ncbi:MFS-type transporter YdeE [Salmonella enterica subsp. arizonae]|uniref:MFS-type transporter YdeE n=1 Tax=Salmonella enterica subsp. arizonae TaxID=59203 RepID=A0A2X4TC69_SALER|nr:MFS-type transporter YdeE [Salmonella enterica subsp. arizonae]